MLMAGDDVVLKLSFNELEFLRVSSHANLQVAVILRVVLSLNHPFGGGDIPLELPNPQ